MADFGWTLKAQVGSTASPRRRAQADWASAGRRGPVLVLARQGHRDVLRIRGDSNPVDGLTTPEALGDDTGILGPISVRSMWWRCSGGRSWSGTDGVYAPARTRLNLYSVLAYMCMKVFSAMLVADRALAGMGLGGNVGAPLPRFACFAFAPRPYTWVLPRRSSLLYVVATVAPRGLLACCACIRMLGGTSARCVGGDVDAASDGRKHTGSCSWGSVTCGHGASIGSWLGWT